MRSEELDRALGATPASFAEKMDQTLCGLKEEKEVKRMALRTVVVFALVTVLLCSTAYALVSKGLEWYYNNRFSAYQENEPDKHQDIMDNLQTDIPQTRTDDPDVSVAVEEVSWAAEHGTLVVSVAATPVDPERYVIYAVDQLDEDGSYMGPDGPVDPDSEERLEHWLWTNDGHGPVEEMIPAGKQLLLFEATRVLCGENNLMGDNYSYDVYTDEEGVCRAVIEYRVEYLAPDYEERIRQKLAAYPDSEAYLLGELDKARQLREMLDASQDGVLTLTIPYRVVPYTDQDDMALYTGGRKGEIRFDVQLNMPPQKLPAPEKAYTTLREGDSGAAVEALQSALKQLGYPADITGAYDSATTAAVSAFQQDNGLMADGVAGSMTQEKLFSGTAQPEL